MVRTQIQLTAEQSRYLKKLAGEMDTSIADLIRKAVDLLRNSNENPDAEQLKANAMSVIGKYRSGKGDIARNHDKYLAED